MKNILKLSFLSLVTLFMITSCEVDPVDPGTGGGGGGTTEEGPEIIYGTGTGLLSSDTALEPGTRFTVQIQTAQGTSPLNSLEVLENDVRLPDFENRLEILGSPAPSAAVLVPADDKDGFTWDITIKAQEERNKTIYKFLLKDEAGNEAFRDIEINTEGGNTGATEPTVVLNGNNNVITDTEALVGFPIEAFPGNMDLSTIAVYQLDVDGNLMEIAFDRCYLGEISGDDQFTSNPEFLAAEDQSGFAKTLYIRSQSAQSIENYVISVADASGSTDGIAFFEVTINTFPDGISGNPVNTLTGVLFNRAGPAGTGGLDLDSGASTGSSDTSAELVDNGIDIGASAAQNWLQRISGTNGTILKQLIPNSNGLLEDFTFDSVTTDAGIRDIWGNATDLMGTNDDLEPWTEEVQAGDMFIALREGKYYMMNVTEVFISPTDNDDFYRMDIKF